MRSSRGCLPPGWCRIEIPRRVSNTSKKYDVYFYTDDGVKLRSFPDIEKYFEEKGNEEQIERSCFNFLPVQTTALHGLCDLNKKLEHAQYLTLNRNRMRKLYSSNSEIVKASDPHFLPISCTFGGLNATDNLNLNMTENDTMILKNDRGTSKLSHVEACSHADSVSCKAVEALCTEQLSTVQNMVVENQIKHDQINSDTQVSSSIGSILNPNATADQPNKYSKQSIAENYSRQEHTPVTTAKEKKRFSSYEKVRSSKGSTFLSTNYIPSNGSKRSHSDHCNVPGVEILVEKSNKKAKKSAENGNMTKSKRSMGYNKSCRTTMGISLRSSEVVDELITSDEYEHPSHFEISQGNGKGLAALHQKKSQALSSTSGPCIKCSHPRRKNRRDVPTKLHFHKKLKVQEQKATKSGAERTQKIAGQLHKGSHKLWLKCHRFSNTEKVHFVQKLHKNWTTSYITRCCGKLSGWTRVITQRQSGSTSGIWDVHYVSPRKERFRSKRAIERFIMDKSINIEPELFCFSNTVFDFRVLTSNAKCNNGIEKMQPQKGRMSSSRASLAEKKFRTNSDSNVQSNSVKQKKSKQWSPLNSTYFVSKVNERKHRFFHGESEVSMEQLINKDEFQVEEKGIYPAKNTNPVIAGDTDCSANDTAELQLQANIIAQVDESQKHSSVSDLSKPLKDSGYSSKTSIGRKRTQAASRKSIEFNSFSVNQDGLHDALESSMSKGCLGLLPTEENAVDTIDDVLADAVRAPTSIPVETNNICSEHYSTMKNSEIISTSNLSKGSDFIDSFTRNRTTVKMAILNNDRAPCRSLKLEDSIVINSCTADLVKKECILTADILSLNNNLDETSSKSESGLVNSDISSYFVEIPSHGDRDKESSHKRQPDHQKPPPDECNSTLYDVIASGGTVTNSKEKLNELSKKDECCSFQQIELDYFQCRDICSMPLQTVSNFDDKVSTGENYEANTTSLTAIIEETRFTENNSLIDSDCSNCSSKYLTKNSPAKSFGAKETRVNTADSLETVNNHRVYNHPFGASKFQDIIDLQPSSSFPVEFNALSLVGQHQDLCSEAKSYSDHFENNTSSKCALHLAEVGKSLSALDTDSKHDLWQGHQLTGLCFEQRQTAVEERGHFSKQNLFLYGGCDLEKSCNVYTGESYNATEDSVRTSDLNIVALPGHLKRKIKCDEKVLQFFKENARNCKKKNSVATDSFIKRCYPEIGNCTKISKDIKTPRMVCNCSSVERPIDKDSIAVSNLVTRVDSLAGDAVTAVSLDFVGTSLSLSVNNTEITKKKSMSCYNTTKHQFPNRGSIGAEKGMQEIKSIKSKEDLQHGKTYNIALQNDEDFVKCLSQNKSRKRRTAVTSPYFNKRQRSRSTNERAKAHDEHSNIKSYQIGNETILQVNSGNVESANFCCKCGCVMTDVQALQSLNVCELCKTRRYSSVAKISHLQNANHKYSYDRQLFYSASRKHDSGKKDDLSTFPKIPMKYYLGYLGLATQSASCGEIATLRRSISHGQPMTHPGTFGSIIKYGSNSQLPILHRRLGIQQFILYSSTQLRKSLAAYPYLCFRRINHQMKTFEKKKSYCSSSALVNSTEEKFSKENNGSIGSNIKLSPLSLSLEGTYMLDKSHRGLGTRFAHSSSHVNSYLMLNKRKDATNDRIFKSVANVANVQASSSSICSNDSKLKNEKDLDVFGIDTNKARLINNVDYVNDRYRMDSDWHCSLFCNDAVRSESHNYQCPEMDSPTRSKEINAMVASDENLTNKDDWLHYTEPLCTINTKQIDARPLDSAIGTKGMNSASYSENMSAKQLRGKHTQVHYIPPRSPFCLIQEQLYEDPWKLLIACLFLNRTTAKQVFPTIWKFFQLWPDPETTMHADWHEIKAVIQPLGLGEVRAKRIVGFSRDYVQKSWTYPIELYGIGKYGNDSYRIFCLGEWEDVQPTDYKLNIYHEWLVEQNRLGLL